MPRWKVSLEHSKRNLWGAPSLSLLKRHAWLSSPIWKCITIACVVIQRLDMPVHSSMNREGGKRAKKTFDVVRLFCYNKDINVTLRKSVSPIVQFLSTGTLRKRVKVMIALMSISELEDKGGLLLITIDIIRRVVCTPSLTVDAECHA